MTGRRHSEAAIEIMREKRTGTKVTSETRAKMSIQRTGRKLPAFTDLHRERISEAKSGDRHSFWGKLWEFPHVNGREITPRAASISE